jgi:hypothetical protein
MAIVDGPKYTGPLILDFSDVKGALVDLPPGAMKGIRTEKEGIDKVIAELEKSIPSHGDAAEIPPQVYKRFLDRTALLDKLRAHELTLEKTLEVCRETRAKTENDREDDISVMAKASQDAARRAKDPGIAAPFQATITYNAQIAQKAVQTRRKNAEGKSDHGGDETPPAREGGQKPPAPGQ